MRRRGGLPDVAPSEEGGESLRRGRPAILGRMVSFGRWRVVETAEDGEPKVLVCPTSPLSIRRCRDGGYQTYEVRDGHLALKAMLRINGDRANPSLRGAVQRVDEYEGVEHSQRVVRQLPGLEPGKPPPFDPRPGERVKICGVPPPEFLAKLFASTAGDRAGAK